jgi:hypothetical protein
MYGVENIFIGIEEDKNIRNIPLFRAVQQRNGSPLQNIHQQLGNTRRGESDAGCKKDASVIEKCGTKRVIFLLSSAK